MAKTPNPARPMIAGRPAHPFRRAVLRGLGLILPPLLTILLFVWAGRSILTNVLVPLEGIACETILWWESDVLERFPDGVPEDAVQRDEAGQVASFRRDGEIFVPLGDGTWIRQEVRQAVRRSPGELTLSGASARQYYERYVRITYLPPHIVLPVFLGVFIGLLYLLGKFLAAGVGRILWNFLEGLIHRLPIIRNVYSSVKQVTDFVFSEQEIQFNRVVAIEYPRKGLWSIGFVTGESLLALHEVAGEPVVTVFLPTSPMPATGFTVNVAKRETIDLDITLDQAVQYVVSCGVVVPGHQQPGRMEAAARIAAAVAERTRRPPGQPAGKVSAADPAQAPLRDAAEHRQSEVSFGDRDSDRISARRPAGDVSQTTKESPGRED